MEKTGIILLAIGVREYGQWARNMAMSCKYHNPNLPITLVHDTKATRGIDLSEKYDNKPLFDKVKVIKDHDYLLPYRQKMRLAPGYAKTNIYKYSDYERTIYLDVDGLCVNPLDELIEYSKTRPLTSHVWDYGKYGDKDWGIIMMWAKPDVVWRHFGLKVDDVYPFMNSSLLIFDKQGEEAFIVASDLMKKNPLPLIDFEQQWGKGNQPDELFFNAACAKLKFDPGLKRHPIYFQPRKIRKRLEIKDLKDYWFLGCWGDKDMNHHSVYKMYDILMSEIAAKGSLNGYNKASQLMKTKFIKTN